MVRLRYPPKRHYPDQWSGCDLGLLLMGYAGTFTVATAYAKLAGVYAKAEILSNAARRLRSPSRYSGGAWGRGCSDAYWLSGPVSRILCPIGGGLSRPIGGSHLSTATVARRLQRPTRDNGEQPLWRRAETRAPAPLLGLAPDGVCLAGPVTWAAGGLLHHPFTLTEPKLLLGPATCSLLHLPSSRLAWALPSIALYGVRTFLVARPKPRPAAARPTHPVG